MIEPNIALAIAAMAGALFYHVAGVIDARAADPNYTYKGTFLVQTVVAIAATALIYQVADVDMTFFTLIIAFITGLGGNAGASSLIRRKPAPEPTNTEQ